MSIEETVYKLKEKYLQQSYGQKIKMNNNIAIEDILPRDLILLRKDNKEELNIDDWTVMRNEDYYKRLEAVRYDAKIELLNEIFEDNPDNCCITGCNINMEKRYD